MTDEKVFTSKNKTVVDLDREPLKFAYYEGWHDALLYHNIPIAQDLEERAKAWGDSCTLVSHEHGTLSGDSSASARSPSPEQLTADLAALLHNVGWKGVLDAQWEGLMAAIPELRRLLTIPGSTPETKGDIDWPREVTAILDGLGNKAIRVREGGGPENLAMSLAVTCAKLGRSTQETEVTHKCAYCGAKGEPGSPKYCSAACAESALEPAPKASTHPLCLQPNDCIKHPLTSYCAKCHAAASV